MAVSIVVFVSSGVYQRGSYVCFYRAACSDDTIWQLFFVVSGEVLLNGQNLHLDIGLLGGPGTPTGSRNLGKHWRAEPLRD